MLLSKPKKLTTDFNTWLEDRNNQPTISVSGISDNQQFTSGELPSVTGSAFDQAGRKLYTTGGITNVSLYDGDTLLQSTSDSSFSFSNIELEEGAHALSFVATDTDGNTTSTPVFNIWVGNKPPLVTLETVSTELDFSSDDTIELSATVNDPDGDVAQVEFFVAGESLGIDTTTPYNATWIPNSRGAYVLTARAIDNEGKAAYSSISVTVDATIETSSINGLEDAAIERENPNTTNNYSNVQIYGRADAPIVAIFKFDISDYLAAPDIRSATLRLFPQSLRDNGGVFTAYRAIGDDWNEETVTWSNGPSKGTYISNQAITTTGVYYGFDITEFINEKKNAGESIVTIWIEDSSLTSEEVAFHNKKTNPPQLQITTSDIEYISDTEAPAAPTNLISSSITQNSLTLSWTASTDNIGVVSYEVLRNSDSIGTTTTTSITDSGLIASTIYSYSVIARDAAGNTASSSVLQVSILGGLDSDSDGIPNTLDLDDDNDGVLDTADAYPLISIGSLTDTDSDGAPDSCDEACVALGMAADLDDDNDGVLDTADAYPLISIGSLTDTDSDGAPDSCDEACVALGMAADLDDDNDGVLDTADAYPLISIGS